MNFIEELYYGNITPHGQICVSTEKYKQAADIVSTATEKLKKALAEPERTMLERLIEAKNETAEETGLSNFKLGFSLGVHMMVDCFAIGITDN